jgi:phosphate uptake regulator
MAHEHTVKAFDDDITKLRGLIAEMGGLAEVSLTEAMEALVKGNLELANSVIAIRSKPKSIGWRCGSSRCARQWPMTCAK